MTQQFCLAGCQIDLTRNLIVNDNNELILPPKTMAVLYYLAKNQGQVLSSEHILKAVWPDRQVSANSVQRCITELRKALGDDGKTQTVIKTHAKQGYSLDCNVEWATKEALAIKSGGLQRHYKLLVVTVLVAIVVLFFVGMPEERFGDMVAVTANDEKESSAVYSPDGKYILFQRYLGLCQNHLWAKDRFSQQEYQLTSEPGWYGSPGFSPDGEQIVFSAQQDCKQNLEPNSCWDLKTLNFMAAFTAPQKARTQYHCNQTKTRSPQWLNDGTIAILQELSTGWAVVKIDPNQAPLTIYAPRNKQIYDLRYDLKTDRLAVMAMDNQAKSWLEIFNGQGKLLSSSLIKWPEDIAVTARLYVSFDSDNQRLLFAHNRRLFSLSYDGEIAVLSQRFNADLYAPEISPDGSKVIAGFGIHDSDVGWLSLNSANKLTTIGRSIFSEHSARFHPQDETIAFISDRSGSEQIWLYNNSTLKQISQFKAGSNIKDLQWQPQGSQLIAVVDDRLLQLNLAGKGRPVAFDYPVIRLFQWLDNGDVLLKAMVEGDSVVLRVNLASGKYHLYNAHGAVDAALTGDNRLIYVAPDGRFWLQEPDELAQRFAALDGLNLLADFVLCDDTLYLVDKQKQLWKYDFSQGAAIKIKQLPLAVERINAVKGQRLLLTYLVALKKEVVELSKID